MAERKPVGWLWVATEAKILSQARQADPRRSMSWRSDATLLVASSLLQSEIATSRALAPVVFFPKRTEKQVMLVNLRSETKKLMTCKERLA